MNNSTIKSTALKAIDPDSSVNQRIKGQLVSRHVKQCFSSTVEELTVYKDGYFWDSVENLYNDVCPHCGDDDFSLISEDDYYACNQCDCDTFAEPEMEPKEILEWWLVDEWFYNRLRDLGEAVWTNGEIYLWGRTTSGQAISLDGVISSIALEMEILGGQKNDWSV